MFIYHNTITNDRKRTVSTEFNGDIKDFLDVLENTINIDKLDKRACGSVSIAVNTNKELHDYSISADTEEEKKRYFTNKIKHNATFQYDGYQIIVYFNELGKYLKWQVIGTAMKKESHYLDENNKEKALTHVAETLQTFQQIFDAHYQLLKNNSGLVHHM